MSGVLWAGETTRRGLELLQLLPCAPPQVRYTMGSVFQGRYDLPTRGEGTGRDFGIGKWASVFLLFSFCQSVGGGAPPARTWRRLSRLNTGASAARSGTPSGTGWARPTAAAKSAASRGTRTKIVPITASYSVTLDHVPLVRHGFRGIKLFPPFWTCLVDGRSVLLMDLLCRSCGCGRTSSYVKCSAEDDLVCSSTCDKNLNCGVHKCAMTCHNNACPPCEVKIKQGKFFFFS